MISNNARVARALYLLKLDLDNFVAREFTNYHQDQTLTVLNQILGQSRDSQKPFQNMKTQDLLAVMQASWWNVFDRAMGGIEPGLVREVALTHESWAGRNSFSGEHAFQALNSVQRLLAAMSSPSTLELDMLKRECLDSEMEGTEPDVEPVQASTDGGTETEVPAAVEEVHGRPVASDDTEEKSLEVGGEEAPESWEDPYTADLLRVLREAGALREEDFLARVTQDCVPAQYADDSLFHELNTPLRLALEEQGIPGILGYQADALSQILAGSHVALEAGLGGDETVTLAVVLAESLLKNPGCHGLVLCPDERTAGSLAVRLSGLLESAGVRVMVDAEELPDPVLQSEEQVLPAVLVASVGSLNVALATLKEEWQSVLKDLKIIALYHAEGYHGHFGANVAVLLRRLAHLLAILGASPSYFVLARGCGNSIELARNLTGHDFNAVSALEAPTARRHYIAVSPRDPAGPGQVDLPDRIARAALACIGTGKSVLVYCPGESLAQMGYDRARELGKDSEVGETALSLAAADSLDVPDHVDGDESASYEPRAVFAVIGQDSDTPQGNFDGVIVAGSLPNTRLALNLLDSAGGSQNGEAFALFYAANDADGRFAVRNFDALLGKNPDHLALDPDIPEIISPHLPALVHEADGRVFSFSREALGNAVFQALRREAASLSAEDEPVSLALDIRPTEWQKWGLWLEGLQVSSLSPYGKFREIYPGSVVALDGMKYRVASIDPGEGEDRSPAITLEGAEALANLRTVPTFTASVEVLEESLCLSLAPVVSLHLGRVVVEEALVNVSVIDESSSLDLSDEAPDGRDNRDLVTATFTPDEEATWSLNCQAFWIDVEGLAEADASATVDGPGTDAAPVIAALEQMFRVGARLTFSVGKYDLATYCQDSSTFVVEVTPDSLGIVKKIFDNWRDILSLGASVARNCRCTSGCTYCLLPVSPYEKPVDKVGGLALVDRLLEITVGS
ncbi:MAG: Swt1 family HEPN domain-containing protein [Chloroflexota bacterium]|nr:Swt1 family HEPN domain-containing protein [Chloroflexota bacterium]